MNQTDDPAQLALINEVLGFISSDVYVLQLLSVSLGLIMARELRRDIRWMETQDRSNFVHISDWLATAVDKQLPWLSNVNTHGVPKKLAKCRTVAALVAEADKQMRRLISKELLRPMGQDDEESFADEGGEFHIVRLKSTASLDRESALMKHCIGLGAYDTKLANSDFLLLSMRDRCNNPIATIEVQRGEIIQIQGVGNTCLHWERELEAKRVLNGRGISEYDTSHFYTYAGGYMTSAA